MKYLWISLGVLLLAGCSKPAMEAAEVDELEALTGARTRVAWCRQIVGNGSDPFATGEGFALMGLDTGDGQGERAILPGPGSFRKPLITPGGDRVVFTDFPAKEVMVVNWDGHGLRPVKTGMAVEVWKDPVTDVDWLYYLVEIKTNDTLDGVPLRRCRLDDPGIDELVWDQTDITPDNWQLSADGRYAGGLFPWKAGALLDMTVNKLIKTGKGCWTSLAPDNSYLMWIFDGAHKNLLMKPEGGKRTVGIALSDAPGIDGFEVYHPRWSNHVRFMAMTGPYKIQGRYNAITEGGANINILVGRFAEGFDGIEAWVQVTDHVQADFFPDVWVEGGEGSVVGELAPAEAPPPVAPPAGAIVIQARLVEATATPAVKSILPYVSTLVEYHYAVESVEQGELAEDEIVVQRWAIRKKVVVDLGAEIGKTYRLVIEPRSAHEKTLEGERVSSNLSDDATLLDVYYDVSLPVPD